MKNHFYRVEVIAEDTNIKNFEDKVNDSLQSIVADGDKIIDIKYVACNDAVSALILYQLSD